jgi:hypothetical protein
MVGGCKLVLKVEMPCTCLLPPSLTEGWIVLSLFINFCVSFQADTRYSSFFFSGYLHSYYASRRDSWKYLGWWGCTDFSALSFWNAIVFPWRTLQTFSCNSQNHFTCSLLIYVCVRRLLGCWKIVFTKNISSKIVISVSTLWLWARVFDTAAKKRSLLILPRIQYCFIGCPRRILVGIPDLTTSIVGCHYNTSKYFIHL